MRRKPLTPVDPGYVTQQFPANQGQFQVRYVGRERRAAEPDRRSGRRAAISARPAPYNINNGKIVTELVGTPIEITVYKLGDKYFGARSNEFGYANYEIIPAVTGTEPVAG